MFFVDLLLRLLVPDEIVELRAVPVPSNRHLPSAEAGGLRPPEPCSRSAEHFVIVCGEMDAVGIAWDAERLQSLPFVSSRRNALVLDAVSHPRFEALSGREIDLDAEHILDLLFEPDELDEADGAVKRYEYVDIAAFYFLRSRDRSEDPQLGDTVLFGQAGFLLPELGLDLIEWRGSRHRPRMVEPHL